MELTFIKASTLQEREAINLFLDRHNNRGKGSTKGYVAYYAVIGSNDDYLINNIVAAAKFCPLHTPAAARFFAGEGWRHVYCLQRLAAKRPYPKNMLSKFVGQCLREMGRDARVHYVATYADTGTFGPDGRPHDGGIYRATNAVYCGMTDPKRKVEAYILDGQRHSVRKGGRTIRLSEIPARAKIIRAKPQLRYCWPAGSPLKRSVRYAFLVKRFAKYKFEAVYQPRLLIRRILNLKHFANNF